MENSDENMHVDTGALRVNNHNGDDNGNVTKHSATFLYLSLQNNNVIRAILRFHGEREHVDFGAHRNHYALSF